MCFSAWAGKNDMIRRWLPFLALGSLAVCLAAPVLLFLGKLSPDDTKLLFSAASAGWFVFATLWLRRR